jgi:hypothetical protein
MTRVSISGLLLATILVVSGCAGPPSSPQPVHSSFGEGPLVDPRIPSAPYGGGSHNAPWSSPNSLPKGF